MPFAKLRGLRIYYERPNAPGENTEPTEVGARLPLLFFNGTGGDLRQRPRMIDGPLAESWDVIAHDQRGLGQSGKPDVAYTMGDYADDGAALLDHLGVARAHVFGVSFGGMVAQEFALRHPARVDRMVLACTSSGGEGGASYPLHELAVLGPEAYMTRVLELGDTRWGSGGEGRDSSRFAKIVEFMKARQQIDDGAAEDGAVEEDEETKAVGARRQLEARLTHDTWDRLSGITAPTYLCGGRFDGIADPQNMRNLSSRIPGSKLEFFEGGHGFLLEDRRAFPRIIEFLRGGASELS